MKVLKVKDAAEMPNPHQVSVRTLYSSEHLQMDHLTLQPGEVLKKHAASVCVVVFVVEGRAMAEIGDERQEIGKDTVLEIDPRVPHRLLNESNKPFRALVLKAPRPTSPAKAVL